MVILGLHTGHDAAAALYANGKLVAYCKEERLTRIKQDGRRLLLKAIDEVYEISGINRNRTNAVSLSRMHLDIKYFRKTSRPARDIIKYLRGKSRMLYGEMLRLDEPSELNLVRKDLMIHDLGLKPDTGLFLHIIITLTFWVLFSIPPGKRTHCSSAATAATTGPHTLPMPSTGKP
ncbi:MAG: carbamoyltransferase N-terminal domain-containing protein [Gammaproteobacteria bacterium]